METLIQSNLSKVIQCGQRAFILKNKINLFPQKRSTVPDRSEAVNKAEFFQFMQFNDILLLKGHYWMNFVGIWFIKFFPLFRDGFV